jgi:hypothetical protein
LTIIAVFRGINKHIHLLADKNGEIVPFKAVNDLQHSRVHPFGGVTGE